MTFVFIPPNVQIYIQHYIFKSIIYQEADSKMLFHVASIPLPANIVIKSIDTDLLAIALAFLSTIDPCKQVWMETGLESKNSLRY